MSHVMLGMSTGLPATLPGMILLVTDLTGRGRQTRAVGAEDLFLVQVPVP
jgi:hypothetical protein